MTRRVGMEIEFDDERISHEILYSAFEREIRAKSNYPSIHTRECSDKWTLKSDPTCGWEITTPAMPFNEKGIREICGVIRSASNILPNDICTEKCGIHVHVEGAPIGHDDCFQFFKMWHDLEPAIWSLHTPNRPNAHYIYPLRRLFRQNNNVRDNRIPSGHSDTVNLRGRYDRNHRYEIRYCESTTNAEDIQFWLMTVLYLVSLGEKVTSLNVPFIENTEPSELQDFIWRYRSNIEWLDSYRPELVEWMSRRFQKMHGGGENISSRLANTTRAGLLK